jgi:hypothetical protein
MNIRVYDSKKPDESFESKTPELEDVYFVTLREEKEVVAA